MNADLRDLIEETATLIRRQNPKAWDKRYSANDRFELVIKATKIDANDLSDSEIAAIEKFLADFSK